MVDNRAPHFIGVNRNERLFAPCGLCGHTRELSKTHAPPAGAGNDGNRYREMIQARTRKPGSVKDGGLWVRGLCERCNNDAGRNYDTAYIAFADEMRTFVAGHNDIFVPSDHQVPAKAVAPGRVARSVLFNMFALWLRLRHYASDLAEDLVDHRHPTQLPPQYRLRVAGYRGRPILESLTFAANAMRTDDKYNVVGAFYFEPFAWALVYEDDTLLDKFGWGDATDWVRYNPDAARLDLRDVLDRFPLVRRPADLFGENGMEFDGDERILLRGR